MQDHGLAVMLSMWHILCDLLFSLVSEFNCLIFSRKFFCAVSQDVPYLPCYFDTHMKRF